MAHDRKVITEGGGEDLCMVSKDRPCPCPELCDFREGRICAECGRKRGPSAETMRMIALRDAVLGGMPVARGEIAHCQWTMLGEMTTPMRMPRIG